MSAATASDLHIDSMSLDLETLSMRNYMSSAHGHQDTPRVQKACDACLRLEESAAQGTLPEAASRQFNW